jgi:hypothetical protein
VGRFFFLGGSEADATKPAEDSWDHENVWAETWIRRPWFGEHGVAIAGNSGGDTFFLDYRFSPPKVSVLNGESRSTRVVANSFVEFISGLSDTAD